MFLLAPLTMTRLGLRTDSVISRLSASARCSALGLVLCSCAGCGSEHATAESEAEVAALPQISVETLRIEPVTWPATVRSQGSFHADEISAVGTRVAGRIAEVHVDLGDRVAAGEPLATMEIDEFELLVEQAEAQLQQSRSALGLEPGEPTSSLDPLNAPPVRQERATWEEAKSSLERARRLVGQNAMAAGEFEQIAAAEGVAEARYAAALNGVREKIALIGVRETELALARQRLADAVVRAPFDGLVQRRAAAPGAYVNVGDEIAVLVRVDPLRFRGSLPERHAQRLALGQQVQLQIESVDEPRTAQVTRISPTLDPRSRSLVFEARIENPDAQLRTGLFAEADVVVNPQAEATVVPVSAVVQFAGAEKVWKVIDGVATEQEVFTGQRRGDRIEIREGLEVGDIVLRDGAEGRTARVVPAEADDSLEVAHRAAAEQR